MRSVRYALLFVSFLVLAACTETDAPTQASLGTAAESVAPAPSERVETQRVARGTVQTTMAASGSIRARRETEIGAEVGGRLAELFVDVGDTVEEGQPLFRIDPDPYEMALAEARAGLALARAESENAVHEAERVRNLVAQRAASEQHYDQLRTAASVARARVAQMEARLARRSSCCKRRALWKWCSRSRRRGPFRSVPVTRFGSTSKAWPSRSRRRSSA
jgi:membrane fusion protein (multidrug efflux system)